MTCGSKPSSRRFGGTRSVRSRRFYGHRVDAVLGRGARPILRPHHEPDPHRARELSIRHRAGAREEVRPLDEGRLRSDAPDGDPSDCADPWRGAYKEEILALAARISGVDLIEVATSRNLAAVFTQIIRFSESELRQMIGWYLDRFDVQNIKTIVRGKLFGAAPAEVSEDIVAAGSLRESFLQSLIELPTLEE